MLQKLPTASFFTRLGVAAFLAGSGLSGQTVPPEYQDLYNTLTTQISGFETSLHAQWNGSKSPVMWAPQLLSVNANQYTTLLNANYYEYYVAPELQELVALGAKAVTIHLDFPVLYEPYYSSNPALYPEFVSFYQMVAANVRALGLKIVVETSSATPWPGAAGNFASYYSSLTWSEYESGRAQQCVNIAQLVAPDYMTVLTEPDSEYEQSSQSNVDTVKGATQMIEMILSALNTAQVTGVTVGAGSGTWQQNLTGYIQSFVKISGLKYIDLHVYPVNESFFTNLLTVLPIIQAAHLPVATSECWLYKVRDNELPTQIVVNISSRDTYSFWGPLDIAFLQAMTDFSNYSGEIFLAPYWVPYFTTYLDYNSVSSETPDQLEIQESTTAYDTFADAEFTTTGTSWLNMTLPAPDTQSPKTPGAPTTLQIGTTAVELSWPLTSDNVGVAGYLVYRNGAQVAQVALPPWGDSGLTPGLTYTYNLTAFDASGNGSMVSPSLKVTTINNIPPTPPTNLQSFVDTQNTVAIKWGASTSNSPIAGYIVFRGSSPSSLAPINSDVTTLAYKDTAVTPNTTYYYAVAGFIGNGLTSSLSNVIQVTTK